MKNKKIIFGLIALIILLTGFLRFYNIAYTEFKVDQAKNIYLALDILKNGLIQEHVLLSSVGTYNPPIFHYLLIIPVLISKSPVVISGFIALLNLIAVILAFWWLKEAFNLRIALITCLLWAVNPWAIMYSRHIWHQNVLPFFIILFIIALFKIIKNTGTRGWIVLASASLACLTQIHLSTIALAPIFLIVLLLERKKLRFVDILWGLLIFLIICMPYFWYEIQHDFYNFNIMFESSQNQAQQHWESLIYPMQIASTQGIDKYLGTTYNDVRKVVDISTFVIILSGLAYLLSVFIIKLIKFKKINKKYLILLLWTSLPIAFMFVNKSVMAGYNISAVFEHYFILLYPVQFILIAIFFDKLQNFTWKKKYLNYGYKIVLGVILASIFYNSFIFSTNWLEMTKSQKCFDGVYGIGYKHQENKVRELIAAGVSDPLTIYQQTCQCGFCFPVQTQYIYEYLTGRL